MSCRGVTLQTRAASAAESRSRRMTSPPLAIRTNASASGPSGSPKCASPIRTGARAAVTEGAIVSLAAGRVNNRNRWLIQDQDREDWRLAGSPPAPARWRFYHLPNRHPHRDVIAPEPALADIVLAERELTAGDDLPAGEHDGTLDHVLELAYVPRPVVFHEPADRLFADRRRLGCGAVAVLREEVLDERGDVLLAIAERRHVDVDHVEAVVEVVAELPLFDLPLEILVGRADDPDIDLDREIRPEPLDLALLQHAQKLRLRRHRHLADLVEEDRSLVRHLEAATALGHRARE